MKKMPIVLFALACASCVTNQMGNLSAKRTGTPVSARAGRVDARQDLVAACGDGRSVDASLLRTPYLQRLDARGARVLWTTTSSATATVRVTAPDGREVGVYPAKVDPKARPERARQLVARIEPLQPDTIYCYEVREGARVVAARSGFKTAPLAGQGGPVRFAVWGDSGAGNGDQHALLRQIPTLPIDLMLHTGDVAYPRGGRADFEKKFFQVYAPLLRHFVDYPVAGNHEYKTAGAAPFREVFDLPGNERWYSFDWGDVHFVGVDTERLGPEQVAWLDHDLATTKLPWTVVFLHKPPFSNGHHGADLACRRWIHPILTKHRVPLVLAGHEHNYERTKPIAGVTYVVTGGGGNGTRPVGRGPETAFSEAVIHFVHVTVEGDKMVLRAIDATGREFDGVVIPRRTALADR